MARPARRRTRRPSTAERRPSFQFEFLGFLDGWYALRAVLRPTNLDSLAFENSVIDWLISQHITPHRYSYIANGNTGDGPFVPALADGSGLCVLLKRPADILRFAKQFPTTGISPASMLTALQGEAAVPRIWHTEIAMIAYDAIHRLATLYNRDYPLWAAMAEADQRRFIDAIRQRVTNPEITEAQWHERWLDDQRKAGWTFGRLNRQRKTHPNLVPYEKLSAFEKATGRLLANIVAALTPLLSTD